MSKSTYEQLFGSMQEYGKRYPKKLYEGAYNFVQQSSYADVYVNKLGPPPPPEPPKPIPVYTVDVFSSDAAGWGEMSYVPLPRVTNYRLMALHKLWEGVINNIVIRHPDPSAKIELYLRKPDSDETREWVSARINITTRDTRNPAKQMSSGFHMHLTLREWPGKRAAELFILGCWMAYMTHETMEMVSFVKKKQAPSHYELDYEKPFPGQDRVADPHAGDYPPNDASYLQAYVDNIIAGKDDIVGSVIALFFGGRALTNYHNARLGSSMELANEAAHMKQFPNGEPGV